MQINDDNFYFDFVTIEMAKLISGLLKKIFRGCLQLIAKIVRSRKNNEFKFSNIYLDFFTQIK